MKSALQVTFAYLAAVIGAGFASGSEAVYYFVRFGNFSFVGIMLSAAGFGFGAYYLLYMCEKHKVSDFESLMAKVCDKKTAKLTGGIMCVFMLILLSAMISAFAEMMHIIAYVPKTLSAAAFCVFCFYILCMPEEQIVKWGGVAGFAIVGMIGICTFYMLKNRTVNVFSDITSIATSSAVYTAYNSFAVCPVLCKWSVRLKGKKECALAGLMSGVGSFFALALIWVLISIFYGKINLGELPMLTLAARQGSVFMYIYVFVIFMSVLSSAVANAYGICLKFSLSGCKERTVAGIVISLGWLLSSLGFTAIVTGLYEYMGYGVLMLLIYCVLKIKKNGDFGRKKK